MKILYKIYSFLIALPLFVIATIITALTVIIAALCGDKDFLGYHAPRLWSKITCWLFLIKVKINGREHLDKRQSYVFLANHQGYFDIFLVYGYLGHNFKWMMKEYLRKIPFVGLACARSNHIYVGDSISAIGKAVAQARQTLQGGMSMVIFPEGTRTYDGQLGTFKRGAFMLANEIGLPIVPITINGSFDVFNRNAKSVTYGRLELNIHEPITEEERKGKASKVIMQQVYDVINSAIEEKYRR